MVQKLNVLVMRHEGLSLEQTEALSELFPGAEIVVNHIDPKTPEEHLQACELCAASIVLLPQELPTPTSAMEAGFPHAIVKDGQVLRLVSVEPVFEPMKPQDIKVFAGADLQAISST